MIIMDQEKISSLDIIETAEKIEDFHRRHIDPKLFDVEHINLYRRRIVSREKDLPFWTNHGYNFLPRRYKYVYKESEIDDKNPPEENDDSLNNKVFQEGSLILTPWKVYSYIHRDFFIDSKIGQLIARNIKSALINKGFSGLEVKYQDSDIRFGSSHIPRNSIIIRDSDIYFCQWLSNSNVKDREVYQDSVQKLKEKIKSLIGITVYEDEISQDNYSEVGLRILNNLGKDRSIYNLLDLKNPKEQRVLDLLDSLNLELFRQVNKIALGKDVEEITYSKLKTIEEYKEDCNSGLMGFIINNYPIVFDLFKQGYEFFDKPTGPFPELVLGLENVLKGFKKNEFHPILRKKIEFSYGYFIGKAISGNFIFNSENDDSLLNKIREQGIKTAEDLSDYCSREFLRMNQEFNDHVSLRSNDPMEEREKYLGISFSLFSPNSRTILENILDPWPINMRLNPFPDQEIQEFIKTKKKNEDS